MQRGVAILLSLTVTGCFTGTVFGANVVLFTMDPDKKVPTMVTETGNQKRITFYSANFIDATASPVPFTLVFQDTFTGKFVDTGPNETKADILSKPGSILFKSKLILGNETCEYDPPGPGPVRSCYWVKMKLADPPGLADSGFLYTVEMGAPGQVIDPRIRGR